MEMNINERDIFNFIFFDRLLSEQKRVFIRNNINDFEQINFYRRLKRKTDSNIDRKTKQIIASKIPAYHLSRQITLFPVTEIMNENSLRINNSTLIKTNKKVKSKIETFVDEDDLFIVRIVKTEGTALIYLFSVLKKLTTDIELILQPASRHLKINKINEPIKVNNLEKVETITLEII
jgi:hypothetical protein